MKSFAAILFAIAALSSCPGKQLSAEEKLLCGNSKQPAGKTISIVIFPQFCGACSAESMKIISEIQAASLYPVSIINGSETDSRLCGLEYVYIDPEKLARAGINSTENIFYLLEDCRIVQKIAVNAENEAMILSLVH